MVSITVIVSGILLTWSGVSCRVLLGYYYGPAVFQNFPMSNIPVQSLTHLAYAFGSIQSDGTVSLGNPNADIKVDSGTGQLVTTASCPGAIAGNLNDLWQIKLKNPHLRTLFSIGGWGDQIAAAFTATAQSESARTKFVSTAIQIVNDYGFDGIDIDWEFPYTQQDNANLVLLLQALRQGMNSIGDGRKYVLTLAAAAPTSLVSNYRLKEICSTVDWINVMTYDYSTDLTVTWHISPMYPSKQFALYQDRSVDTTIRAYVSNGANAKKLVMGVPLYGYLYSGVSDGTKLNSTFKGVAGSSSNTPVAISYSDVNLKLADNMPDWKIYVDGDANAKWTSNQYTAETISYTDSLSDTQDRVRYVIDQDLGGLMFWQLSQDSVNPAQSIVRNAATSLVGGSLADTSYPVCAPKSTICNIETACPANMNFQGADVAGGIMDRPQWWMTGSLLASATLVLVEIL